MNRQQDLQILGLYEYVVFSCLESVNSSKN